MLNYEKHSKDFGEMGVVRSISTLKYNIENQGMTFLGYAKNHMGGTYSMLNIRTKLIALRRDVTWMN